MFNALRAAMRGEESLPTSGDPPAFESNPFRNLRFEDPDTEVPVEAAAGDNGTELPEEPEGFRFDVGNTNTIVDTLDVRKIPLRARNELLEFVDMQLDSLDEPAGVWDDSKIMMHAPLELPVLTNSEIVAMGQRMLNSITKEMSEQGAAEVLVLAWQLRKMDKFTRVFPQEHLCHPSGSVDVRMESLPVNVMKAGTGTIGRISSNVSVQASAYAYIAASMIRLFTKSADSYVKAMENQLKEKYYSFYHESFPFPDLAPDLSCIESLSMIFSSKSVFKGTLAPFLYHFTDCGDEQGMCRMLFEQHLSLTGMHAVNLFFRAMEGLHAEVWELSSFLWHRSTSKALLSLCRTCRDYIIEPGAGRERKTWRYARLYGPSYFRELQTKNCKPLVCTLAMICKEMGVSGNRDVMQIAHIRNMGAVAKEEPDIWAKRAVRWFHSSDQVTGDNPFTKR